MEDPRLFAATLRQDLPVFDLHGFSTSEALDKIESFIYTTYHIDTAARIVYGIGTGRMKDLVVPYLRKHPMIDHVIEQEGNCIVLFAK